MCEVLLPLNSLEVAQKLLSGHNILIRTLSEKLGLDGASYCRIAIKTEDENERLASALCTVLR